jgi:hypothetical protein
MMPVKIECACGQHYAFDVEPVNGRMPSAVACPACGADGTASANDQISQQMAAQAVVATEASSPMPVRIVASQNPIRVTTSAVIASTPTRRTLLPGQVDRTQAEHEARAKAMWGDSKDEVTKYLMIQGFSHQEALDLVEPIFRERAAAVRNNGIRKILIGSAMMCVPIVALIIFLHIGVIPMKIFGLTLAVGFWGVWLVLNGIIMVVAPKTDKGDLADQ